MKASKKTKRALIPSILAVIMCVAMLVGTTFAWFTDTASTSVNKIEAGTLDVTLEYASNATGTGDGVEWTEVTDNTVLKFLQSNGEEVKQSDSILWEPGCTYQLPALRISNNGNLALKYKIEITGIKGSAKLNEVIDWTISNDADSGSTNLATTEYSLAAKGETTASNILTIKGHMQETAGNDYQGLSISGIAITVLAAQNTVEYDSKDNQYDKKAAYDGYVTPVNVEATEVNVTGDDKVVSDAASVLTVDYTGATLNSDTTRTQSLEYKGAVLSSAAQASITVSADSQAVASYELTLPLAAENTAYIPVTIKYTPNLTGIKIYHSGTELEKKNAKVDSPEKEYFTYNSDGTLTLYLKSASPIDIVYDKPGMATVTTAAELTAALANTTVSTIVLGGDVTTASISTISRDLTIDLNNYTLTYTGDKAIGVKSENTKFILKNGKFAENGALTGTSGVIVNFENTTTTLDNVTATTDASLLYPEGDASAVNVVNCNITAGAYGVATNAGNGNKTGITINISDSTVTTASTSGDNCAVLMNVGGTLNITNSTITGDRQGVFLRAGTATITGSTIKTTGVFTHGDNWWHTGNVYNQTGYWGSGNEAPRGALIVGSCNDGTVYAADAVCTISGTTLVAENNAKEVQLAGNGPDENDDSKYKTTIYCEDDGYIYGVMETWGGTINVSKLPAK